jgi:hypothetical protein
MFKKTNLKWQFKDDSWAYLGKIVFINVVKNKLFFATKICICLSKSIFQACPCCKTNRKINIFTLFTFCHRRMGRGGHLPSQNFYGRAKSNAKFGQNFKISEKL